MCLRPQVHKASPLTHRTRLSNLVSERREAVEVCVHRFGPIRDMLESFAPGLEKVTIHRRSVVVLLNQLNLQGSRIGQGNAESGRRGFPAVAEVVNLHVLKIKKRTDAEHGGPVLEGGGKVSHYVTVLPNFPKDTTHTGPPFCVSRHAGKPRNRTSPWLSVGDGRSSSLGLHLPRRHRRGSGFCPSRRRATRGRPSSQPPRSHAPGTRWRVDRP